MYCTECSGLRAGGTTDSKGDRPAEHGALGYILLPPAGVRGRAPHDVLQAAEIWTATEIQAVARGICPRCSGTIDHSAHACEGHAGDDGQCEQCGQRFGATFFATCTNCIFDLEAPVVPYLAVHTDLIAFMIDHGVDPVSPEGYRFPYAAVDEMICSTDPFEARFTFTADEETLTLTVDDDLSVVDITRGEAREAD